MAQRQAFLNVSVEYLSAVKAAQSSQGSLTRAGRRLASRLPALRLAERAIVERRHDGLSRARGGDEKISRAPELALPG
ncbi:MAG: hypothetical protein A3G81_13975 [Betaproteobacteria bacterium RIFCSPLOWO2_12_FULL_65_14]|nr:MAG: hypothetical protein A3G81_13975 [Betaproteobacteria bacterium RIFCSPLOWO2_12_FULL_65_14]